jgi:hypothetical protein
LEEIWAKQYQATNEVYESAKAVKEQREDNAPTVTLRDFVAQYLKEINFLKTMEYTAAEKDKVIEHQANYSALKEALDIAMAADSRVRNNIFAIIDTESEEGVQQVVLFTSFKYSATTTCSVAVGELSCSLCSFTAFADS